jgi:ribosome-associated protein
MRRRPWEDDEDVDRVAHPAPPSKSRLKRDHLALQALGRELVECPDRIYKRLPLPDRVREGADLGRRLNRGALQRQLRHLAGVLETEDHATIRAALAAALVPDVNEVRRLHRLEQWRDRLLTEGDAALEALVAEYPEAGRAELRQLVRSARQAVDPTMAARGARALFQTLKALDRAASDTAARVDQ